MNPKKWFDLQNGGKLTDTRETINGFPCRLILVNDGDNALQEGQQEPTPGNTKDMGVFNFNNDKSNTKTLGFDTDNFPFCASFEVASNSDTSAGAFMSYKGTGGSEEELAYIKESFELRFPDEDDVGIDYGFLDMNGDTTKGLKRVIDFVDKSSDEDFIAHFEEYFNKQYTFRYFLLVMGLGMVDNLGKNMMLDTWDGQIFYPRFYDMDTICSFNNSGVITFDTDIEMEQGYWNTSSSRLWTRVRDLFHSELVTIYKDMRQNGFSYEKLMQYFHDEQIAKIPETYYNKDYDVKYAPYADQYMGMANGSSYEHLKRWLKRRILFTDTLYDYAPSYADSITIRANTTEEMTIEIETYAPVYQHMSWYNNQMDKKKIDGKTAVTFTGTAQASTDQEVIIYGGSNIKRIRGISTMNPDSMIIGNASKLVELECSNAPLLTDINQNKANLSPNSYLTKVDISNCPLLGGTLRLNNSPLLQEVNAQGTAITGMILPTSIKNLGTLRVAKGVTELTLNDAKTLTTLDLEEGYLLETLSLSNCNKLKSFDLSKVKNITLDNSYVAEEIRLSTNQQVNLRNMETLKRLVFTPNSEVEEFNLATLKNSPDVTITSFNCPKLKEFITTAPQRISYGKKDNNIYPYKLFMANKLDLSGLQIDTVKFLCTTDIFDLKLPNTLKNFYCDSAFDLDTNKITDGAYDIIHSDLIKPYTEEYNENVYLYKEGSHTLNNGDIYAKLDTSNGKEVIDTSFRITGYLEIKPGSGIKYTPTKTNPPQYFTICCYDKNKNYLKTIANIATDGGTELTTSVNEDAKYIRCSGLKGSVIKYITLQAPNIVPTSANGSLLFNINQDTPQQNAPYIWDLQRLKLNDFHTYGVNNKVEIPNDSCIKIANNTELVHAQGVVLRDAVLGGMSLKNVNEDKYRGIGVFKLKAGSYKFTTDNNTKMTVRYSETIDGIQSFSGGETASGQVWKYSKDMYFCIGINNTVKWLQINDTRFVLSEIRELKLSGKFNLLDYTTAVEELSSDIKLNEVKSITMPKRLADYKVQIKNADITPNQYNTMLYPKLVDTTLPITGKIDYTKYKGKYLSWAFAYTTNDVERLPLDSRSQGQIINDYNKLYGTDFVDIVDVWAYKDDDFTSRATNENITKAYIELTQSNYKTRIDEVLQWYPNCTELYLFEDGSVTQLNYMFGGYNKNCRTRLKYIEFMDGYFNNLLSLNSAIRDCSSLERINRIPNSVNDLVICFYGCSKFNQQLDLSEYNILSGKLVNTWNGCSSLTYTPILPSTYTGSLDNAFNGTKITTAPVLPDGVTSLNGTFRGCPELTTVGNIPSSCNIYEKAFDGCTKLTSVPETGWKDNMYYTFYNCRSLNQKIVIESASALQSTFFNCSSLSITPTLPETANASMDSTFYHCTSLEYPPQTPLKITSLCNCYRGCSSLKEPPIIPNNVGNILYLVQNSQITNITIPLDTIGSYENALQNCTQLTDITWSGKRTADFNLNKLGAPSYTQDDVRELVPEHLEDLYKDKIKISFGDNKITVNGKETTITT